MGNLETIQLSGNLVQTVFEARSALGDVNLLHNLQELGHPYGVILTQLSQASSFKDSPDEALSFISLFSLLDSLSGDPIISSSSRPSRRGGYQGPGSGAHEGGAFARFSLGTVAIKIAHYHGKESFFVKTADGEPVTEIQPGDPLAFIHLNRQSTILRQISPLERIQTMAKDLQETFSLIDSDQVLEGLHPKQQKVLIAARSAVIVGISHLVPIFRRRTGLPFWKLDVLPEAIQQLHRLDSQAVSNKFGGQREVRVEDIEMMVVTPDMRRILAA